jgi:hypothetical protein
VLSTKPRRLRAIGWRPSAADRTWAAYEQIVEDDLALPRSDWWDEFYAQVKPAGHE